MGSIIFILAVAVVIILFIVIVVEDFFFDCTIWKTVRVLLQSIKRLGLVSFFSELASLLVIVSWGRISSTTVTRLGTVVARAGVRRRIIVSVVAVSS